MFFLVLMLVLVLFFFFLVLPQANRQSEPHAHAIVLDPYFGKVAFIPDLGMVRHTRATIESIEVYLFLAMLFSE